MDDSASSSAPYETYLAAYRSQTTLSLAQWGLSLALVAASILVPNQAAFLIALAVGVAIMRLRRWLYIRPNIVRCLRETGGRGWQMPVADVSMAAALLVFLGAIYVNWHARGGWYDFLACFLSAGVLYLPFLAFNHYLRRRSRTTVTA